MADLQKEFPYGRWVITWGVAAIPVIWFFIKHQTIDKEYNTYELGNSGELFMVTIVMMSDLILEILKIKNGIMQIILIAFVLLLLTVSLLLFAIVPHTNGISIKDEFIKNLRDESYYCFIYGLCIGTIVHIYMLAIELLQKRK